MSITQKHHRIEERLTRIDEGENPKKIKAAARKKVKQKIFKPIFRNAIQKLKRTC